jgi:hypothetical protein
VTIQSCITVMIFKRTTSSPEESLASNLQCETVLLSSTSVGSKDSEVADIRLQTKKLWRAESAADVMGPLDRGERIRAKKGPISPGRGSA